MSDGDAEFVAIFRDEANERLDNMVAMLLALESGTAPADALDALFRDAHTIKGGAAMLGFDEASTLAHAMEDVLAEVRALGALAPEVAEQLLHDVDTLRRHVAGDDDPPAPSAPARTPGGRAIRVPAQKIDRLLDLVGETVLHRRRLEYALGNGTDPEELADELDVGGRLFDELKDAAIRMRTVPLAAITAQFPRAVHDIASDAGKEVDLVVTGEDVELDRVILETLAEPLVHLIRNAVGHGVEAPDERRRSGKPARGRVELRAEQRGGSVEITVADDGRGVSQAVLEEARREGSLAAVLTRPGFSTAAEVTGLSGRGVGLDAVRGYVESFNGALEAESRPGAGTQIVLRLPLALALVEVLLVERGRQVFGLPLASVEQVRAAEDGVLEVYDLADLLGAEAPALAADAAAVVLSAAGRRVAVACDRLVGQEEVIVKPLGPLLPTVPDYLGAAILGDGRVALLLDSGWLTRATAPARRPHESGLGASRTGPAAKVLVVEDSSTVRELQRGIFEAAGYRVATAGDGREGLELLERDDEIALVLTDLEMPGVDGFELTRAIRARGPLPVVVVTSHAGDGDRRRAVEAGADAYMVKQSFDQNDLLATVERLLAR